MAGNLAYKLYGYINMVYILGVALNYPYAGLLYLVDYVLILVHSACYKHVRLKGNYLLNIGLGTGFYSGDIERLRRIIAVCAAAYHYVARTYGIHYLAHVGAEDDGLLGGPFKHHLAAKHIGNGYALCIRLIGRCRLLGRDSLGSDLGGLFRLGSVCGGFLLAGGKAYAHRQCSQKGNDLGKVFHGCISSFLYSAEQRRSKKTSCSIID